MKTTGLIVIAAGLLVAWVAFPSRNTDSVARDEMHGQSEPEGSGVTLEQEEPKPQSSAEDDRTEPSEQVGVVGDPTRVVGSVGGTFTSHVRILTRGPTSQRDVVIYLRSLEPARHEPAAEPVPVVQHRLRFEPHVVPILRGGSVVFQNEDEVDHNVFSTANCCAIDIDMTARTERRHRFEESGIASIVCRLHPEMSLWIVVLDEPWFTRIELEKQRGDGARTYVSEYAIKDVPPGRYALTSWSKSLPPVERSVVVEAGLETVVDLEIMEDGSGG